MPDSEQVISSSILSFSASVNRSIIGFAALTRVNAAKPIIDRLTEAEKDRIELLITCSESGIDFGKSLSTYIHDYLGLNRNCRLFELKTS